MDEAFSFCIVSYVGLTNIVLPKHQTMQEMEVQNTLPNYERLSDLNPLNGGSARLDAVQDDLQKIAAEKVNEDPDVGRSRRESPTSTDDLLIGLDYKLDNLNCRKLLKDAMSRK